MNPEFTSTIAVYAAHLEAAGRIALQKSAQAQKAQDPYSDSNVRFSQPLSKTSSGSPAAIYCLNLMVFFRRFEGGRMADDVDLIMSLYDPKEARFITENYVVRYATHTVNIPTNIAVIDRYHITTSMIRQND